jgi:hypothetical protein
VHSVQVESLIGVITPEGSPLFKLLDEILDDC